MLLPLSVRIRPEQTRNPSQWHTDTSRRLAQPRTPCSFHHNAITIVDAYYNISLTFLFERFGIRVDDGYCVVIEKKPGVRGGSRRREVSVAIGDGIRVCSGDPDSRVV